MDFLSAPSNFLVQWFRNFESKDLGPRFPSLEFSRSQDLAKGGAVEAGCSDLLYVMYCFIT